MKIIDVLKELPLIQKKLDKNAQLIAEYASSIDVGANSNRPFPTIAEQTNQVASLVQSSVDLVLYQEHLRRRLSVTNSTVKITIDGQTKTIVEWIDFKNSGCAHLVKVYSALTDQKANQQIPRTQFDPQVGIKVVRHFDEKEKNDKLQKLMELQSKITAELEKTNAITDIVEAA